jgi:type I restriction enzyme, S subunit
MKDLPKEWILSTIGECFFEIRNGTTIQQNKEKKGLPVSRIETIQNGGFALDRVRHIEHIEDEQINLFRYQIGDIAFSHINSYEHAGKTALYQGYPEIFIHGMNLLRLRLDHAHIDPKYAYLFMQSSFFRQEVRQRVNHAVNQVSINQTNLSKVPFIIAPLNEQRRIVAKLEKILAKVNNCQQRLERIPTILKRFRQSVLAAACSALPTSCGKKYLNIQFWDVLFSDSRLPKQ